MARRSARRLALARLVLVLLAAVAALSLWWLDSAFEERHWREFRGAGERALERGNLEYAEKMLRESLQYAERYGEAEHMARSYVLLARLYRAQGDEILAGEMLARARDPLPDP